MIGGSLAGLAAARALSDHVEHVTVVDRDAFPHGVTERPGVSQARHPHGLLARGRQELERLFPGFDLAMIEGGAHDLDVGSEFAVLRPYGWQPRRPSGLRALFASRLLLESVVRELARTLANVSVMERTDVVALLAARDATPRVAGVRTRSRQGGAVDDLAADLVIDASGRTSKSAEWLRALGLEPPDETVVDSFAGYSSRWYRAPPPGRWPAEWWWKGIWIDPADETDHRGAVLTPVEDGQWMVTLAGVARDYPPRDEAGFDAALGQLRSPAIAEAVRLAEAISPVFSNRAMANRFRHYERWRERLDGYLALGDAVCAFNPVYGQGMTCAAVGARLLADVLAKTGAAAPDLAPTFFRAQARFLDGVWSLATGADFRFAETVGDRPPLAWLARRYADELALAVRDDPGLMRMVIDVFHLLEPPSRLFGPTAVARTAIGALRRLVAGGTESSVGSMPAMEPVSSN